MYKICTVVSKKNAKNSESIQLCDIWQVMFNAVQTLKSVFREITHLCTPIVSERNVEKIVMLSFRNKNDSISVRRKKFEGLLAWVNFEFAAIADIRTCHKTQLNQNIFGNTNLQKHNKKRHF